MTPTTESVESVEQLAERIVEWATSRWLNHRERVSNVARILMEKQETPPSRRSPRLL